MNKFRALVSIILNRIKYRENGCIIQRGAFVHPDCCLEGKNLIGFRSDLRNSHLGYGSYVSADCVIADTKVGRYTCIGPQFLTAIGQHPTSKFVSIHPAFYSVHCPVRLSYVNTQKFVEYKRGGDEKIVIGNDVWIGARVTVMDGVSIGDGAIVATGAVVTENVEPYSIVGGIPARIIKRRFNKDEINKLQKLQWWNKDYKWIKENAELFEDIALFIERSDNSGNDNGQ